MPLILSDKFEPDLLHSRRTAKKNLAVVLNTKVEMLNVDGVSVEFIPWSKLLSLNRRFSRSPWHMASWPVTFFIQSNSSRLLYHAL